VADPESAKKLRELFESRLNDVAQRALKPETELSGSEIDGLTRLSKLCDMVEGSAKRRISQWQYFALMAAALALVSFLLFKNVPSTAISGNAVVSTLTFRLRAPSVLSKGWSDLKSAGISQAAKLLVPAFERNPETVLDNGIVAVDALAGDRPGDITIAPLALAAGITVTLEAEAGGSYKVQLRTDGDKSGDLSVKLNIDGAVRVKGLDRPAQILKLTDVVGFTASADKSLTFAIQPSGATPVAFQPLLPVNALEFSDIEVIGDGVGQTLVRSTVRSGALFLEELGAKEVKLREAEDLTFDGLDGVIRSVTLQSGAIAVNFEGSAREVTSHGRSLKPSWLEFLRAQKPVELLWGSALGLLGAVLAALKWLKVEV
jgi:hypothetical protein